MSSNSTHCYAELNFYIDADCSASAGLPAEAMYLSVAAINACDDGVMIGYDGVAFAVQMYQEADCSDEVTSDNDPFVFVADTCVALGQPDTSFSLLVGVYSSIAIDCPEGALDLEDDAAMTAGISTASLMAIMAAYWA